MIVNAKHIFHPIAQPFERLLIIENKLLQRNDLSIEFFCSVFVPFWAFFRRIILSYGVAIDKYWKSASCILRLLGKIISLFWAYQRSKDCLLICSEYGIFSITSANTISAPLSSTFLLSNISQSSLSDETSSSVKA